MASVQASSILNAIIREKLSHLSDLRMVVRYLEALLLNHGHKMDLIQMILKHLFSP